MNITAMKLSVYCCLLFASNQAFSQDYWRAEQQAIQQAVALANPSIVRIETVGGVDLVGDVLAGTGPTTGVIVSDDGYIITSRFNFFAQPSSILVTVPQQGENQRFAAKVICNDESKMLTLLKIETSGLTPISGTDKEQIKVGQRAIALGRTFDLDFPNISTGIVSALKRVNGKAIQTDTKTSPVNYGGPLIDLYGRSLGIIVPLSPQQSGEAAGVEWYDSGIGFAIPFSDIERVLPRMKKEEVLKAGLLGVSFAEAGPLSGEAKVIRVRPQSPADQAGIQQDDVIEQIDGRTINRLIDLKQILGNRYAGESVAVAFRRGEELLTREIELTGELVDYQFPSLGILPTRESSTAETTGVGIRYLFEGSPATEAGLLVGDRIIMFDNELINAPEELAQLLTTREIGEEYEIQYLRGETEANTNLQLASLPDGDGATNIPPADIPPGDVPEELKLGRFNQKLTGNDRSFWVHVPENYNPAYPCSLLVWIHPAQATMESEVLQHWQDFCAERGIILVGPRAEDLSGWSATDEPYVTDVVAWVRENYSVDANRIAVMGQEDGGTFATRLAFKYRDLFRGLIAIESPLRSPPPENQPEQRLLVTFVAAPETRERSRVEKSVEFMREREYPTALIDSEEQGQFSTDLVNSLIQWIDALDRL